MHRRQQTSRPDICLSVLINRCRNNLHGLKILMYIGAILLNNYPHSSSFFVCFFFCGGGELSLITIQIYLPKSIRCQIQIPKSQCTQSAVSISYQFNSAGIYTDAPTSFPVLRVSSAPVIAYGQLKIRFLNLSVHPQAADGRG